MRRKKEYAGQMDLMDFLGEPEGKETAVEQKPKGREGEYLYLVNGNQMECVWVIESRADKDERKIHICQGNSSENVFEIREEQIGVDVFTDLNSARIHLNECKAAKKISREELEDLLIERQSFALLRQVSAKNKENKPVTFKTIALCKQGIFCMDGSEPILHYYGDAVESAERQYRRMVEKIQSQSGIEVVRLPVHYEFCDLYQCSPSKYSSLDYYLSKADRAK